ncbi:MAG: hypothetical protein AABX14_01185 [Candidatus Aenigmatarchaeota archaeon]
MRLFVKRGGGAKPGIPLKYHNSLFVLPIHYGISPAHSLDHRRLRIKQVGAINDTLHQSIMQLVEPRTTCLFIDEALPCAELMT